MIPNYGTTNPLVTEEDLHDHESIADVIHRNDMILLFKHIKYGWWTLPIGKVKTGETPEESLFVELKEELDIIPVKFSKVSQFTKSYDRGNDIITKVTCHIFDIESYEGETKNMEKDKHQWMLWGQCPKTVKDLLPDLSDATKYYIGESIA